MATADHILASRFAEDFSHNSRNKGEEYFRRGAVSIQQGSDIHVDAAVKGTHWYTVTLRARTAEQEVLFSCTCPYYTDTGTPCKHVWATLRAAEQAGHLTAVASFRDAILVDEVPAPPAAPSARLTQPGGAVRAFPSRPASWRDRLLPVIDPADVEPAGAAQPESELLYVLDFTDPFATDLLTVTLQTRVRRVNGTWGRIKPVRIRSSQVPALPDQRDRLIVSTLLGARQDAFGYTYGDYGPSPSLYRLAADLDRRLVPLMCETGRAYYRTGSGAPQPLSLDPNPHWQFWLEIVPDPARPVYSVRASLRRDGQRVALGPDGPLVRGNIVVHDRAAGLLEHGAWSGWANLFASGAPPLDVPLSDGREFIREIHRAPYPPHLDLPPELEFTARPGTPVPQLRVLSPTEGARSGRLRAQLWFEYDGVMIPSGSPGRAVVPADARALIWRDTRREADAIARLRALGFKVVPPGRAPATDRFGTHPPLAFDVASRELPEAVRVLLADQWHIEAEGRPFRAPGTVRFEVKSGIDWFELHGDVEFGDQVAPLPSILAALRQGHRFVPLGDGTVGILPEDWLTRYGIVAELATTEGSHLRFRKSQGALLDALLAVRSDVRTDEAFAHARGALQGFEAIVPRDPPQGFRGTLREYQRDALGWFEFLRRLEFGGCLADDMGLGKTVMVLALLEERRQQRVSPHDDARTNVPSLVVVPRSLVFNWKAEAARFAPHLRLLDHTELDPAQRASAITDVDAIITTYGTLRRDIFWMKDLVFEYVILDEAQAIKNANSDSAKAARLLRGQHRLALSGTPIENHLGELWSLFEFLNPGMLGAARQFNALATSIRNGDVEGRRLLAAAVRPFVLRRTKDAVARELPPKIEQTIYCELDAEQRGIYEELRQHYRRTLLQRIERQGMNKSKMQVLEALLRLRQAACHPALIDRSGLRGSSAKLDVLVPQLAEIVDEGHKVLVFSQFTSFLAIVREALDREGLSYEYLDGATQNRQERVERFQSDPECRIFLISLKAGGLGLNLTAAEYVFLLDPWWNPAVETQAIDRTHRIGQTRHVFAYRLIARDTVEEKVLQLQASKRELADAIIAADENLIRSLGRDELELLLS